MNKITFYMDEVENVLHKRNQSPICAEVDPSNYCNNKCSFCCFSQFLNENQEHLSFDLFKKFIDEFVAIGGEAVTFTGGGEPLMNLDFLKMALYAHGKGLKLGLVTNGTLLHTISGFESMFRFIRISINAHNEEVYHKIHRTHFFPKVVANIQRILEIEKRPDLGLSVVICDANRSYEEEIVAFGEELGVDYVQIKPDINRHKDFSTGLSEGIKIISPLQHRKKFGTVPCAIAGLVFILNATGDVYYCCVQRGNPDFRLGNIKNFCISDFVRIRERFSPDLSQCTTCRYTTYAEHYERYKGTGYIFLRHKEFL